MTSKRTVLFIEDDLVLQQVMKAYFDLEEITLVIASNGKHGIEQFTQVNPDVVVTDLRMPGMDGLEVVTEITKRNRDIPVIVMSGMGDAEDSLKAIQCGAWDYLEKPCKPADLLHAVKKGFEHLDLVREKNRYRSSLEHELEHKTEDLEEGANSLISNVNIESHKPLPSPDDLKHELSLFPGEESGIISAREEVKAILDRRSSKFIMIVGPCSIHCTEEALVYAERLKRLSIEVSDKITLIMRVYFEKPRTTIGWKGLIFDPNLDDSQDIAKGIFITRKLLRDITEMGLPTATEILDPILTPFVADLICWAAIGARTTESQTHRQLVSGLSMPVGFKNTTDGNARIAADAIVSAANPHTFLGIRGDGGSEIYRTRGNPNCHVVLRGSDSGPNFDTEAITETRAIMEEYGLTPNIIVDCSHGNSGKHCSKQPGVLLNVIRQRAAGEKSIVGVMIESNLREGKQKLDLKKNLEYGVSITDECLGWDTTEALIRDAYKTLP